MIKKRLLLLAHYPIKKPQSGGQIRAAALLRFYKKHFETVRFYSAFHKTPYPPDEYGRTDIPLGDPKIISQFDKSPHTGEIIIGRSIRDDFHVRSQIAKVLMEYKPQIIHVEQVFLYAGLKPLLKELNMKPQIIFGSQNIEYTMKQKIFKGLKIPKQLARDTIEQVYQLEQEFSKEADLVISVSESDAQVHKEMGAKRVIVAKNGIEKHTTTSKSRAHWQAFKAKNKVQKIITFVGSGHPPNWMGFLELIGDDTSFIPHSSVIVLAGGIADYFNAYYKKSTHKKLWFRVKAVGKLSDDELGGLLAESDVIILPITSGGGSNLKTAEAILQGKKVVATSFAFRGYEEYKNLPNIYIADDPADYKKAIIKALHSQTAVLTSEQEALAEQVQWEYTLQPITKELRRLTRPSLVGVLTTGWHKIIRKAKTLLHK